MHASFICLILVSLGGITNALRLPVVARRDTPAQPMAKRGIRTFMMTQTHGGDELDIDNAKDVVYATNITLGGKEFPIQLDTGSSDVWVQPPFSLQTLNDTDIQVNLTFGIGEASGTVSFAEMELGDYKVANQAFLNVTNATSFGAIFSNGIFGILGLSFDQGSSVFTETFLQSGTNSTAGRTFLSNVFGQNVSAPNMFTVLLGRTDDTDGPQEGIFTIGEYDKSFPQISSAPKLPRTPAQLKELTTLPRWSVQLDNMKVNGQPFQFNKSNVAEAAPGKTVAVLDTGFTFSQIPPAAVDAIYKVIPGAIFNQQTGLWEVPCENTVDLTFEFGGVSFPIDPLDITVVKTSADNKTICNNAFRGLSLPPVADTSDLGLDMILGVSFLKNAYASFDFGDWTPQNTTGVPFVQMVPTTDPMKAADTFKTIRQKQVTANDQAIANPTPASNGTATAGSIELEQLQLGKPKPLPLLPRRVQHAAQHHIHAHAHPHVQMKPAANGRMRIVVSTHRIPIKFKLPFMPHAVNDCASHVLEDKGPAVLALLSGVIVLAVVAAIAGIVVAVKMWRHRRRQAAGYEAIVIKDEEDQESPIERY